MSLPTMEKMRRDVIRKNEQKQKSLRRKFDEISMESGTIMHQPIQRETVTKPMSVIFSELMNRKDPSIVYSGIISIGRFCMTDDAIQDYLNKKILCKLYHWQLEGLEFIENRENDRDNIGSRGLMLCDEMGLGKTIMSLQRVLIDNQECCRVSGKRFNGPTLIVVKDILLVENWLTEMRSKWPNDTFHYYRLYSSGNEKLDRIYLENCCDFVIVTYSTVKFAYKFMRDSGGDSDEIVVNDDDEDEQSYKYDILYNIVWKRIIADESHIFAKKSTLLYKAMIALQSSINWAVSASPIQNAWSTIYSSYNFIQIRTPVIANLTNNITLPTKEQLETIESIKKIVMIRRLQYEVMQQQHQIEQKQQRLNNSDLKLSVFTKVTKRVRIIEFESDLEKLIYYQYAIYGMKKWRNILERKLVNKKEETTNIAHIIQLMIQICMNIKILPELVLPHGLLTMNNSQHLPLKDNNFNEAIFEGDSMDSDDMTISCFASHLSKPCKFTYNSKSNIVGKTDGYILEYRKSLRKGDNTITALHDMTDINYDTLEWDPYKKDEHFNFELEKDRLQYKKNYNQLVLQNVSSSSSSSDNQESNEAKIVSHKNKKDMAMQQHILSRSLPFDFCSTKNLHVIDYITSTQIDDKVIVFSNNIKALHALERDLTKRVNIKSILVSGETTKHNTSNLLEFANDSSVKVLLLSLKLGCMGLNLICANHVIFLHEWWNPTIIDQAGKRPQRLGQTKPVHIIHFVLNKTIELFMANICFNKRRITSDIIGDKKNMDESDEVVMTNNSANSSGDSETDSMDYSNEKNDKSSTTISSSSSSSSSTEDTNKLQKRRKLEPTDDERLVMMDDEYDKLSDISAFSYNFAEYSIDRTL